MYSGVLIFLFFTQKLGATNNHRSGLSDISVVIQTTLKNFKKIFPVSRKTGLEVFKRLFGINVFKKLLETEKICEPFFNFFFRYSSNFF